MIEMNGCKPFVSVTLLTVLSVHTISCRSKEKMSDAEAVSAAPILAGKSSQRNTPPRPWPGAYPEPVSLKGLQAIALRVYAEKSIPSDRLAPGRFAEEIERRTAQELLKAGIMIANENEAQAVLKLDLYLSCEVDGSSCGYQTHLDLQQWVQLYRDTNITVAATTWSNSYTSSVTKNQVYCCLPDQLALDAATLVKGFVHDLQTAKASELTP